MSNQLRGIIPILLCPFNENGGIDEASLRSVLQFELAGMADGIGINGFATEAYKMTDAERLRCAEIVAEEINGQVPLIIGMAPGSIEAALEIATRYAIFNPAALMTLPPNTMKHHEQALVDFYIELGNTSTAPIMVQQSPQIPAYAHCQISTEGLAEIAHRAPNVQYFKIEGPGSAERIRALKPLVGEHVALFGGVGGIALKDELAAGAAGLLPGCGFNEYFGRVWQAWEAGRHSEAEAILQEAQPLVDAVSSKGHEFSLHARKFLFHRKGLIDTPYVRRPTVAADRHELEKIGELADSLNLRISLPAE